MFNNYFSTLDFISAHRILYVVILVWSIIWKGLALWRSARRGETIWYVILLLINTVGILDIIYYFLVGKTSDRQD